MDLDVVIGGGFFHGENETTAPQWNTGNGRCVIAVSLSVLQLLPIRTKVRLTYCVNDRAQQVLVLNSFGLHS